jgi:hypothetical protein
MKPGWGQFFMTQRGQFRVAFDSLGNLGAPMRHPPCTEAGRIRDRGTCFASGGYRSFFLWFSARPVAPPSDDTQERGIYRFVCVDAKAGAFVPK